MRFIVFFGILFLLPGISDAQVSSTSDSEALKEASVSVYYFHFTRRCLTCNTVEEVSKKAVEKYGDKVAFYSVNLDEEEGQATGNSLDVSGQGLWIIDKENRHDLTNEGFLYARSKPKKLIELIQSKIDPLI